MNSTAPLTMHSALALRPFADQSAAPLKILFNVRRWAEHLDLSFAFSGRVAADLSRLVMPEHQTHRKRRDELWKSTCLEIFVGASDQTSYLEFNLSPSGDWNLYAFDGYRAGMRRVSDAHEPMVEVERASSGELVTFHASLRTHTGPAGELMDLLSARALVMGVAAVVEYHSGEREYWALAHAGEKPDFHLRESFRLSL